MYLETEIGEQGGDDGVHKVVHGLELKELDVGQMVKRAHLAGELWTATGAPVLLDGSVEKGIGPIGEMGELEPKVFTLAGLADVEPI
jgi:hypothetical protein